MPRSRDDACPWHGATQRRSFFRSNRSWELAREARIMDTTLRGLDGAEETRMERDESDRKGDQDRDG